MWAYKHTSPTMCLYELYVCSFSCQLITTAANLHAFNWSQNSDEELISAFCLVCQWTETLLFPHFNIKASFTFYLVFLADMQHYCWAGKSVVLTVLSYDVCTAMTPCLIIGLSKIADTSKSCITCLYFSFHCHWAVMAASFTLGCHLKYSPRSPEIVVYYPNVVVL